jgi:predicted DNA-binding transcriptional regulator AlpA
MQAVALNSETRNLLTAREVAEQFGVVPKTVWRWVERGDFPAPLRLSPRKHLWNAIALNDWLDAGCPKVSNG